jgi:hypothetical protein
MQRVSAEEAFEDRINRIERGRFYFLQQVPDIGFVARISENRRAGGAELEGEQLVRGWNGERDSGLQFRGGKGAGLAVRREELLHLTIEPVVREVLFGGDFSDEARAVVERFDDGIYVPCGIAGAVDVKTAPL